MTPVPSLLRPSSAPPPIVGRSPATRLAVVRLERFAASHLPVVFVGPTGTGKDLFAQQLHRLSGRSGQFVDVNCAALPREMIESILFGHRRGSFTGAVEGSEGLVADAAGGTLFLDELSSFPVEGQAKLLRLLETREVRRLGDRTKRPVDFRLVSAVQEDIMDRVAEGTFRADLYYRVAGLRIDLPALHSRPEDIRPLAEHFAASSGCRLGSEALELLESYSWPGNVRELRGVIERAVLFAGGTELTRDVLHEAMDHRQPRLVRRIRSDQGREAGTTARAELIELCAAYAGDRERIASALSVSVATVYRRLRAVGLTLRAFSHSQDSQRENANR
jgi:transcriptional regulator with PAS, ATPase and Fis domain